ncbi:MAG: hypothetical protein Q9197_007042, partial [Variospora fuerteventurae]
MYLLTLLPLILTLTFPTSAQQGTITLTLATSSDETATTLSLPFNTLFTPTTPAKGIAIHVSSGTNVPLAQDEITCQCFADAEGTQALGETFTNDFPGAELAQEEPVQIGSILCSDRAGLEEHFTTKGVVKAAAPSPSTTTTSSSSSSSSSSAPPPPQRETSQPPPPPPTAFLLFALSTDPSDDSSSQMPVPISGAALIPTTGNKRAGSVKLVSVTGMRDSDAKGVVCQAFGDADGAKPLGVKAFGLEEEEGRVLDEEGDRGLRDVKAVG